MSTEKMEWENAEERLVEGYKDFDLSVIYILTGIVALLLWMFFTVVVGTGWFMMIVLAAFFTISWFVASKILIKVML
ncbi:MAG: hypothetical protein ACPGVN_08845 [Alphaproteobacteria bacterium]